MGSDEWILDTGASFHFTTDRDLLHGLQLVASPVKFVRGPDGKIFPVRGSGSVQTEKFNIPDVLYIDNMVRGVNIISVSKLSYDHHMSATFFPDHCTLALASGKTAGKAVVRHGMYVLQYLITGQDADASLPTGLEQPELEETSDQERSQQELPLDDEAAASQAQQVGAAMQRVLDRFGLSRFNRKPNDPSELPIRVGTAYYAAAKDPYDSTVFFLDSGTTHHMVPEGALLDRDPATNINSADPSFPGHIIRHVHVANDRFLPVAGIGNITRANNGRVTIENVLHVPGLPANLVSVSQLMTQLASQLEEQLQQNQFAIILQGTTEPELQINRLARRIPIDILPRNDVIGQAHPVTIGQVQVGCSSLDVNGLYPLHDLWPCPHVNLVPNWAIQEAP